MRHLLAHQVVKAQAPNFGHAVTDGTDARKNQAVGLASYLRVVGYHNLNRQI